MEAHIRRAALLAAVLLVSMGARHRAANFVIDMKTGKRHVKTFGNAQLVNRDTLLTSQGQQLRVINLKTLQSEDYAAYTNRTGRNFEAFLKRQGPGLELEENTLHIRTQSHVTLRLPGSLSLPGSED